MPTVNLAPVPKERFVDSSGLALVGGKVFVYAAGTTVKQVSYSDAAGTAPNTNPVILDARGEANIWLDVSLPYKLVLAPAFDTDPPTASIWTVDNIPAANSAVPTALSTLIANLLSSIGATLVWFIAAGVGAIARSLQSKGRDFVSITDFGADPTGVADSTAAINAAGVASKSVYFPPGTYKTSSTITIPDNSRWWGAGVDATTITLNTTGDLDVLVVGWFTTLELMTITTTAPAGGAKGCVRCQSLTNAGIPTNVGGNNWTNPAIGGLSYKNLLRNLVITGGQNYGLFLVNPGYTTLENLRVVLSHGGAGNLFIQGNSATGINLPQATTVNIVGGEYTASYAGPGISMTNAVVCTMTGVITEGNFGRGLVLSGCGLINMQTPYVENNFALGAGVGDGDIVVINSDRINIEGGNILSNNSNAAVAGSGNSNCVLQGTKYLVIAGTVAPLALDAGWVISKNSSSIVAEGIQSGGRWVQFADGTSIYSKKVTLAGIAITSGQGSLFVQAGPQADADFPAIFMADGLGGFVFAPSISVMSSTAGTAIWAVATGASLLNNTIRYRLAASVSTAAVTVDVYITLTGRWQ